MHRQCGHFFFALSLLTPVVSATPISTIYFFGDSLTDAGNVGKLTAGVYPNTPYAPGRFSNGPVWSEYFSNLMGLPDTAKPAGMSLGANYFNLEIAGSGGNNFAIGGARNDTTGTLDAYGIPSGVYWQLYYSLTKSNFVADPNALYVLFGGGNDLRDASLLSPAELDAAATVAAEYLVFSTYILEELGARNFLIMNAPNIGNTPEAKIERNNEAAARAATETYNNVLGYYVGYFQTAFPATSFEYFDTFALFEGLYADALNGGPLYGLTNATTPCFAGYAGSPGTDCSTALFADDIHPTTAVHQLLAEAAFQLVNPAPSLTRTSASPQIAAVPEPASAWLCVTAFALLVWKRRAGRGR